MDWYGIEPIVPTDPARALKLAVAGPMPLVRQYIARRVVDDAVARGAEVGDAEVPPREPRAAYRGDDPVGGGVHRVRQRLPMPLLGIDSDNGSEFINQSLYDYCQRTHVTFTRSRPWKKNDSAHVEQKNGAVVRQLIGYDRFASKAAYAQLRRVYTLARLHVNFFQPVERLVMKTRTGARAHRVYDRARTPYQRLCAAGVLSPAKRDELERLYQSLNPLRLRRDLEAALDRLWAAAAPDPLRPSHTEVATPSSSPSLRGSQTLASVTLTSDVTESGG